MNKVFRMVEKFTENRRDSTRHREGKCLLAIIRKVNWDCTTAKLHIGENKRKNGRHDYLDVYVHPVNYM